jgi:UDP-N-acetylmuramoylalanine--D-glutamate ligase
MNRGADIAVLGLGRSGQAVAEYAAKLLETGEAASVTAIDGADNEALRGVATALEQRGVKVLLNASGAEGRYDLCVASPGLPPHSQLVQWANSSCVRLVSEIEFAFARSGVDWVAVTGTNGKTTTTALLTHLLCAGGISARAVGNIGTPPTVALGSAEAELLVAEVSSFQLSLAETFHPKVAVLLNLTEDHVDWHGSFDAYRADKGRVFENLTPSDLAVIDVDDAGSAPFAESVAAAGVPVAKVSLNELHPGGAGLVGDMLVLDVEGDRVELTRVDELRIRGAHNVSNALAAAAAAFAIGVSAEHLREGLKSFAPVPNRLEPVGMVDGVEWFNDSKATNPDAVLKAVQAFGGKSLIVLLGGRNKGNDFRPLAEEVARCAKAAVLFGEAAEEFTTAFAGLDIAVESVAGLGAAVEMAAGLAEPGDIVVLSPACASFDEFRSYEHRGAEFKGFVEALSREVRR